MKQAKGLCVSKKDSIITGILYETTIVKADLNNKVVQLDTNGWETAHTKKCINRILSYYEIDAYVYQKNYQWFVQIGDKSRPFQDDMKLDFKFTYEKVS